MPIILGWLALTAIVTLAIPSLEQVAREHAVSLGTKDAPSVRAMARIGKVFKESDSDAMAMIVIEGDKQLGDDAHHYYQDIIGRLKADPKDVQHIQDFWGDPLTAAGAQSPDGKAAYVQLNLVGNQGETSANNSVAAVRKIVDSVPAPKGVKAYVTGSAAVAADGLTSGDKTIVKIMITTVAVIFVMLLFVYRSFITVALLLAMVGVELAAARGIVAFLALHDVIRLSTFATNMLVSLAIAAGTDYGIFFIGRYHEARHNGEDRKTAYLTAYRGVAHVVLASGLTIAGATYCLSFARLPVFQTVGAPCAVGMLVAVAVALTLIPAVIAVGSRFGLLEPKRLHSVRGWRRVGTAVVRWPAPIFAATCAVAMVGLLALPGYKVSYIDRDYAGANYWLLLSAFRGGAPASAAPDSGGARLETLGDVTSMVQPAVAALGADFPTRVLYARSATPAPPGAYADHAEALRTADLAVAAANFRLRQALDDQQQRIASMTALQALIGHTNTDLDSYGGQLSSTRDSLGKVMKTIDDTRNKLREALGAQVATTRRLARENQQRSDSVRASLQGHLTSADVAVLTLESQTAGVYAATADLVESSVDQAIARNPAFTARDRLGVNITKGEALRIDTKGVLAEDSTLVTAELARLRGTESDRARAARGAVAIAEGQRAAAEGALVALVDDELRGRASSLLATLQRDREGADFGSASAAFFKAVDASGGTAGNAAAAPTVGGSAPAPSTPPER